VFDAQEPDMTLSQIAERAALDAGTTFRLVKTLVMLGYVRQSEDHKRYRLGLKILDLGFNAIGRMDLHAIARPILRSLVGPINEAASIAVLDGADCVYAERVQLGLGRLGVTQRIGSRVPAYSTAVGHAILAHLPLEQRLHVMNLRERVKLTPHTPVSIPEIEARLELVRKLGYALSDQDTVLGVRVIAAPILDPDGQPWAALSAAAPSFTCSLEEYVAHTAGPVMKAAETMARILRISGSTTAPGTS
jgi:IclR family pca regulon transcriptional regulator